MLKHSVFCSRHLHFNVAELMPSITRRALLSQLLLTSAPVVEDAGKHTLVCVFLRGGADTLNLLVPYADDAYYKGRASLAIAAPSNDSKSAVRLNDHYGLHPMLKPLADKFHDGRLSFVQGVGIRDNSSGSHFESQDLMEHGDASLDNSAGGGWLGRFLHARAGKNITPLSAVAIGTKLPESLRGAPSVSVLQSLDDIGIKAPSNKPEAAAAALAKLYGADVTLLGERGRETLDLFHRVSALQHNDYHPANDATYPKDEFGSGLREIARLIKAGVGLEVACVDLGGWDTHFLQGTAEGTQAGRAKLLADGLAAFDADIKAERDNVSVFVMTEFGRRLYENSSLGTDHGRGFASMLLSNKVKGGRVIGSWPALAEEASDGPGGMKIHYDYRSVFSEVLRGTMGLAGTGSVFPDFKPESVGLV
jgi:uncharacterized protein (DUF1501 family)